MRLLLDTHALLWWLGELPKLGAKASRTIGLPTSQVYVSAVSATEMSVKSARGKLAAPEDLEEQLAANNFTELGFSISHGVAVAKLPAHHGDPFDRMLVAQAHMEGLTLVTSDRALAAYGVSILSASV